MINTMKKNTIPRDATKLEVTFHVASTHYRKGETAIIERNTERGYWVGNGCWIPACYLQDPEVCSIKVIGPKEDALSAIKGLAILFVMHLPIWAVYAGVFDKWIF